MMFGWGKKETEKKCHGIPTVRFDPAKVTKTVKADLRQNIKALAEVGPGDFETIYDAALRSISAGRALHILYQALLTIDGMSKRRAEEISLSLNNKATSLLQSEGQERLGIEYAYWISSGAPCGDAEQDAAHKSANRTPYRVNKGMFLNGRWTLPGREDGCKCISKSIIVGFDGYVGGVPGGFEK
jgi:hypothetical protein